MNARNTNAVSTHPVSAAVHQMSHCTIHYAQALTHAFSLRTPTCIPDQFSMPSKKVRCLTKGTFSSGSAGNGYILLNPHTKVNNANVAVATNSSYAGTISTAVSSTTGSAIDGIWPTKLPYGSSSFSKTGVQGRVVGIALRIRYTGPDLYKAGRIIALSHPDNNTLVGISGSSIIDYEQPGS